VFEYETFVLGGFSVKRLFSFFVAAVFAAGSATPQLDAGYLASFTGNTFPSNSTGASPLRGNDGHVNFAVLDHSGGTPGDTWGTGLANFDSIFSASVGSASLDTSAAYLYLFQTINDGVKTGDIARNTVEVDAGLVTSYGKFSGVGFTTNGVPTAPGIPLGVSALPGNPSSASVGALNPGVSLQGSLTSPLSVNLDPSGVLSAVYSAFGPELISGHKSIIWGYTSNSAPGFANTGILDGVAANGTVPYNAITPEPASFAMLGFGLLTLVGCNYRRKKLFA